MRLELDVGNTRIKWRLRDEDVVIARGAGVSKALLECVSSAHLSMTLLDDMLSCVLDEVVSHVAIGSVVPQLTPILVDWSNSRLGIHPVLAEVRSSCAGVRNGYRDVEQMGVDRWLAILAAYQYVSAAVVIVDAGSAITIDVVSADGVHQGGYISPGLDMMNRALFGDTGRVQVLSPAYPLVPSLGKSTNEAVISALPLMCVGLVQDVFNELAIASEARPSLVVTGGNGKYLSDLLAHKGFDFVEYIPELVLNGLVISDTNKEVV